MDWKETYKKLIRRGELILDLESLKNHRKELENMNEGRPGPRYKLADSYIQLLAAIRYLYGMMRTISASGYDTGHTLRAQQS